MQPGTNKESGVINRSIKRAGYKRDYGVIIRSPKRVGYSRDWCGHGVVWTWRCICGESIMYFNLSTLYENEVSVASVSDESSKY